MKIFGREPALWVATIVAIVIAVIQVLVGDGIISDALAGRITDLAQSLGESAVLLIPFVTAFLTRPTTTPVAAPKLPAGTPVENPAVPGGDVPPPDLVVAPRNQVVTAVQAAQVRRDSIRS